MTSETRSDKESISSLLSSLPFARGRYWPPFHEDWDSQLDLLAEFEPRPDDIIVISYPKCGHHWSHEFLSMMISGEIEMPEGTKGDNFIEFGSLDRMEEKTSPRLILTHLPYEFLPKKILENRNKIIRISRNPKDVCVSLYNHNLTLKFYNFAGKLSDFFEVFMEGKTEYGSFFEFERRFKAELGGEDRVDHVFHTSFEELKKDSFGQIKKMGEFLGFERTDEFYERVVDKSSFQKVKAVRDQNEFYKNFSNEGRSLYRKGQVGDWVNHLTVAQSRRIDAMAEKCQLEFVYEL